MRFSTLILLALLTDVAGCVSETQPEPPATPAEAVDYTGDFGDKNVDPPATDGGAEGGDR